MEVKGQTILEQKIGERVFQLLLEPQSPLGEVFDALCHMKSFIIQKMQEANKHEDKPASEE